METKKDVTKNDVNVNQVKPEFKFKDGSTKKIIDLTGEELDEAILFVFQYRERQKLADAKMAKLESFLMLEHSLRNHTEPVEDGADLEEVGTIIDFAKHLKDNDEDAMQSAINFMYGNV